MTVQVVDEPLPVDLVSTIDLHYRLFVTAKGEPTVVCMQLHDYSDVDIDQRRFLTADAFEDEAGALRALNELLTARVLDTDFGADARAALILAKAGMPLTRAQAVDAHLAGAFDA